MMLANDFRRTGAIKPPPQFDLMESDWDQKHANLLRLVAIQDGLLADMRREVDGLRERVAALEGAKCSRLDDMLAAIEDLQTVSNQRAG